MVYFHHVTLRQSGIFAELVLACSLPQECLQQHNLKPPPFLIPYLPLCLPLYSTSEDPAKR